MNVNDLKYLPTYEKCYVCGQNHPKGLRIRFLAGSDGQVQAQFHPDDSQTGYDDIVHGGVISALLDELLGWPIVLQTGRMCFTKELTVCFLRPVLAAGTYVASARPGTDRGRYWEADGDLRDDKGKLYARANAKYFLLSAEQTIAVIEKLVYQPGDLRFGLAELPKQDRLPAAPSG